MRSVLSLTDVTQFPIPKSPSSVIFVAATNDGYIPKHSILELQRAWPGSEVRWVTGGHVSSFIPRSRGSSGSIYAPESTQPSHVSAIAVFFSKQKPRAYWAAVSETCFNYRFAHEFQWSAAALLRLFSPSQMLN